MKLKEIYINKEGEPMGNPEMGYPEKPEAKYEHNKAGIYRHTQWYKETGGYKDPTEWFNRAIEKYHSGLLPFEDIIEAIPLDVKLTDLKPDTIIPVDIEVEVVNKQTTFERYQYGQGMVTAIEFTKVLRIKP